MAPLTELALFAGAGGGLLAARRLGLRTVCYVDRDERCVEVLKARIRDGALDDAPIWSDVRAFDGRPWRGCVDLLSAGFPCQPFSQAGRRQADGDERNAWPDTARIIREVEASIVWLENVPGLLSARHLQCPACDWPESAGGSTAPPALWASWWWLWGARDGLCPACRGALAGPSTGAVRRYLGVILGDLAASGYDARWDCIPASAVGANHQRDRAWILAWRSTDALSDTVRHIAERGQRAA